MSKLSYATTEKNVKIIHRNAIPALKSIEIGNNVHNLGLLLDFRKNRDLAAFLPEQGRFSLSWVHLKKEETLSAHAHPTASMIIITEGEGVTMGDIQQPIAAGRYRDCLSSFKTWIYRKGKRRILGIVDPV
jgi:hypothetical protein